MPATEADVVKALEEHVAPILGGTIHALGVDDQSDDFAGDWPWHCLVIKCEDGKTRRAWINRDPEGNGSGHLDITEE